MISSAGTDHRVELRVTSSTKGLSSNPKLPGAVYADTVCFAAQSQFSAGLEWYPSLSTGREAASRLGKMNLVYFYSPKDQRARNFEQMVLADPVFRRLVRTKYVLVRVNLKENRLLSSQLRATRSGVLNVYDSQGVGVGQIADYPKRADLLARLRRYVQQSAPAAE